MTTINTENLTNDEAKKMGLCIPPAKGMDCIPDATAMLDDPAHRGSYHVIVDTQTMVRLADLDERDSLDWSANRQNYPVFFQMPETVWGTVHWQDDDGNRNTRHKLTKGVWVQMDAYTVDHIRGRNKPIAVRAVECDASAMTQPLKVGATINLDKNIWLDYGDLWTATGVIKTGS